ncbi:Der GTPase-activating protein YihI [Rosenbergiella australiborealis]|uniref:Der GTPase-activating protein YihI n=1 Tax=Rosenbergiella australiborealis TaxID=1544696 RepID=A0ABS5T607_9GAMM|nr:Der GTPase-activating protein YihI [Rosenbergiella australiborealis]MBT0727774.1 Der GTPase-activating protein YihI [Rosenbergiella australiborealis]
MKQPSRPTKSKSTERRKTRAELNLEGRERKRKSKLKGNVAGNRSHPKVAQNQGGTAPQKTDPRLGSKTPVPLIAEGKVAAAPVIHATAEPEKMSRQQELRMLENDPRLDQLLDRLEAGETLSSEDQTWLEARLDRIEELMVLLGIEIDDDEKDDEAEEDMYRLLKGQ